MSTNEALCDDGCGRLALSDADVCQECADAEGRRWRDRSACWNSESQRCWCGEHDVDADGFIVVRRAA
jgi:hypothetical protein